MESSDIVHFPCRKVFTLFMCLGWAAALSNLAINKPTSQSSRSYTSQRAVDGDDDPDYFGWSCSITSEWWQHEPWWRVDLAANYLVFKVSIRNRGDCCSNRLANFDVKVGKRKYWPTKLCYHREEPVASGAWLQGECERPLEGRYVRIQIVGPRPNSQTQILTLCEVQVWGHELHTHAVQEGSSLTLPCSSAENRAFQTRAWYRGFQFPDKVLPDPDMVLYSQTANRLIPDPDPGAIENVELEESSFNLTISSVRLEEGALTCSVDDGNVTLVEYHKLNVYIQPVIKMTGLETTHFRFFTRVTVTCSIDRLFPPLPLRTWRPQHFVLQWGNQWPRYYAAGTQNEDMSYNYTVTKSQVVAAGDDGKAIKCRVVPRVGDPVEVKRKITVHNRNAEVEAVLGLTVFLVLCVLVFLFMYFSPTILPFFKRCANDRTLNSSASGTKRKEKKLTFDINALTAEMYDDGL